MGTNPSSLRYLAPVSFVVDVAAQTYGVFSKPSMLDVHTAYPSAFSPQPYSVLAFFAPQQILQAAWLYHLLFRLPTFANLQSDAANPKEAAEREEAQQALRYVPVYALGNFCIAAWMVAWNNEALVTSDVFVLINAVAQLLFVTDYLGFGGGRGLGRKMDLNSRTSVLTHGVAKTFAGIGVLDTLHNTAVAFYPRVPASTPVKVLTGLGFAAGAAMSDWIMGACLAYDLVGLALGQSGSWRSQLGAYAAGTMAITVVKNWIRPPYRSWKRDGYSAVDDGALED